MKSGMLLFATFSEIWLKYLQILFSNGNCPVYLGILETYKNVWRNIACVQLLFYIEIHFIPGSLVKVFSQSPSVMVIILHTPGTLVKNTKHLVG